MHCQHILELPCEVEYDPIWLKKLVFIVSALVHNDEEYMIYYSKADDNERKEVEPSNMEFSISLEVDHVFQDVPDYLNEEYDKSKQYQI